MRHTAFAVCLAAVAAVLTGCGSNDSGPATFTARGTVESMEVRVTDGGLRYKPTFDWGDYCQGFADSPVRKDSPIAIVDAQGKVLASSVFRQGFWEQGKEGCMYLWKIPDVPVGQHLYHVKIGKRTTNAYTQAQAEGGIHLTWGSWE